MESANNNFTKVLSPLTLRISIITAFTFTVVVLMIMLAAGRAHSESDVSYRQESIFLGAGLSAKNKNVTPEINPSPEGLQDQAKVIGMSYEVDKVTPTPTPVFDPTNEDVWLKLADCESHKNWKIETGNGYYGGLQFSAPTWNTASKKVGLNISSAHLATREEQIMAATWLQKNSGWGQWPSCTSKLGLR